MLNIDTAAARLAREIIASEEAIDEALIRATGLMHSAALAQRDVGMTVSAQSQSTMLRMQKIAQGLIEARGEAARVHSQLTDLGRELGATEQPTKPDVGFTRARSGQSIAA